MKRRLPRYDRAEVARLARKRMAVATRRVIAYWYLKFYVDDEQIVVNVWSSCWDGTVH